MNAVQFRRRARSAAISLPRQSQSFEVGAYPSGVGEELQYVVRARFRAADGLQNPRRIGLGVAFQVFPSRRFSLLTA